MCFVLKHNRFNIENIVSVYLIFLKPGPRPFSNNNNNNIIPYIKNYVKNKEIIEEEKKRWLSIVVPLIIILNNNHFLQQPTHTQHKSPFTEKFKFFTFVENGIM